MQHTFFGFSITEWVGLIGILTAVISGLGWIFNRTLDQTMLPLRYAIRDLSEVIKSMERDNATRQLRVDRLGESLESHLIDSQEIKTKVINLEKEVFRRGGYND